MQCGILIIGSLLWDDGKNDQRAVWRAARLDVGARVPVRVPIYYGRKSGSRGDTYTMAFGPGESAGQAVLVPCIAMIDTAENLIVEANALWQAEAPNAKQGTLHKSWGCVGALFGPGEAQAKLSASWTCNFKEKKVRSVSVVNASGMIDIGWPTLLDGKPSNFDIILATANKPDDPAPSAQAVADVWADQCGNEDYFFKNVRHGIRTADDGEIWRRIEAKSPCWLKKKEYQPAIEILRSKGTTLPRADS